MRKVITYGVFDLFHEGHRRLLERAAALGDNLTVGITTNTFDELRGKLGTVDSFEERKANVLATGVVDEVIPETHVGQKVEDIIIRGIDVFAIGSDWVGRFDNLRSLCEVVYLDRTPGVSSSKIRDQRFPVLKLGILGSGRIARRFVPEVRATGRVEIAGVYNPNLSSAVALQSQFKLPFATDSIDELFDQVEAVYIATPHETHVNLAKRSLEAGKHVLVEKPLAFSADEASQLFDLARERGLILREALKTAYCPGFTCLMELVESGCIGDVVDVDATFTRLTDPGVRERDDRRFGGSFLELGSYCLLPVIRLLGSSPEKVSFDVMRDESGLDLFTKAQFGYGRAFATAKVGLGAKSQGHLVIAGTQGYILVAPPWWKTGHVEVHHEDPSCVESYDFPFLGDGLRYEISDFHHAIRRHEGRVCKLSPQESIGLASLMEAFLRGEGRL